MHWRSLCYSQIALMGERLQCDLVISLWAWERRMGQKSPEEEKKSYWKGAGGKQGDKRCGGEENVQGQRTLHIIIQNQRAHQRQDQAVPS